MRDYIHEFSGKLKKDIEIHAMPNPKYLDMRALSERVNGAPFTVFALNMGEVARVEDEALRRTLESLEEETLIGERVDWDHIVKTYPKVVECIAMDLGVEAAVVAAEQEEVKKSKSARRRARKGKKGLQELINKLKDIEQHFQHAVRLSCKFRAHWARGSAGSAELGDAVGTQMRLDHGGNVG